MSSKDGSGKELGWTTLLGKMMIDNPTDGKSNIMRYEAFLCQCAYLSRLSYTPSEVFCRMVKNLEVSPDYFNDYITTMEGLFYQNFPYDRAFDSTWLQKQPKYQELFNMSGIVPLNNVKKTSPSVKGMFYKNDMKMNLYFYYHHDPKSRINADETMFVVFKGSSSIDDFIHDAKFVPSNLLKFPYLQKMPEAGECLVHRGFLELLQNDMPKLVSILTDMVKMHKPKKIVICGHSLGGALATVFSFALVKGIELGAIAGFSRIPIHLITFGAPTLLGDRTRIVFNQLLTSNRLTFDRVNSKIMKTPMFDIIPTIPPGCSHPGYNILKDELFPYKRTGRTERIGELRNKIMGAQQGIKYNDDLYAHQDFLGLFQKAPQDPETFRKNLRHLGGTTKKRRAEAFQDVFPDAKKIDTQAINGIQKEGNTVEGTVPTQQTGGIGLGGKWSSMYKEETKRQMPNQVIYNCYKTLSGMFCHASYMGVGFLSCLRVPSLKSGPKKEPCNNYYLVQHGGRLYSTPIPGSTSKTKRCQKLESSSSSSSNPNTTHLKSPNVSANANPGANTNKNKTQNVSKGRNQSNHKNTRTNIIENKNVHLSMNNQPRSPNKNTSTEKIHNQKKKEKEEGMDNFLSSSCTIL